MRPASLKLPVAELKTALTDKRCPEVPCCTTCTACLLTLLTLFLAQATLGNHLSEKLLCEPDKQDTLACGGPRGPSLDLKDCDDFRGELNGAPVLAHFRDLPGQSTAQKMLGHAGSRAVQLHHQLTCPEQTSLLTDWIEQCFNFSLRVVPEC